MATHTTSTETDIVLLPQRLHQSRLQTTKMLLYFSMLLLIATAAHATETWNSFRGNPQLNGVAQSPLPADLDLLWTHTTQDAIESTAAISNNTVFIGSLDNRLYALDLATGALKWQYQANGEIKSSATVYDSTLYFGDEHGTFHAVQVSNGQPRWTFNAEAGITSSANRANNRLYFGSYDQHLYCLDAISGTQVWQIATDGYIHGTPALYDESVAVAGCVFEGMVVIPYLVGMGERYSPPTLAIGLAFDAFFAADLALKAWKLWSDRDVPAALGDSRCVAALFVAVGLPGPAVDAASSRGRPRRDGAPPVAGPRRPRRVTRLAVVAEAHVVEPAPPPLLIVADEVGGRLRGFLVAVHASGLVPASGEGSSGSRWATCSGGRRDVFNAESPGALLR